MDKHYIGDDAPISSAETLNAKPSTYEELCGRVSLMDVFAECEKTYRGAIVRVQDFTGTSQYLAKGQGDLHWLTAHSSKMERRGNYSIFHFELV